jgi:hypothetical protein
VVDVLQCQNKIFTTNYACQGEVLHGEDVLGVTVFLVLVVNE